MVTAVCTGGEIPPHSILSTELLRCHFVISADAGIAIPLKMGIKSDLWIGDRDSSSLLNCDPTSSAHRVLTLSREKDETDTEAAVIESEQRSPDEIWIFGGAGMRMDHWLANLQLIRDHPNIRRWFTAHEVVEVLCPGTHQVNPGLVSIFPLDPAPQRVRSEGLKWPLEKVNFHDWFSLSNEAETGSSIEIERGRLLVIYPYEGALRA